MELQSVDISSAFTNGDLEEVIYMHQPEGFHEGGPNLVCRLKKSLYGLKQAARRWNKKLHSVLLELGFSRLQSDRSVYIYTKGEVRIIMPVYINDITLASKNTTLLDQTILDLSKHFKLHFKLRDLGETKFLLGVEIILFFFFFFFLKSYIYTGAHRQASRYLLDMYSYGVSTGFGYNAIAEVAWQDTPTAQGQCAG
jgi:hypothetical protein